jgi:hypothetical protein
VFVYAIAAAFNLRIPRTGVKMRRLPRRAMWLLLPDFWRCNRRLWHDKLGQISLATTTLFWGVSGNCATSCWPGPPWRWATAPPQASNLVGVVAMGTAAGAVAASMRMRLDRATAVLPLGMPWGAGGGHGAGAAPGRGGALSDFAGRAGRLPGGAHERAAAAPRPQPDGAGRSIAVQNFNEQAAILVLGAFYSAATGLGLPAFGAIVLFGAVVVVMMG